MDEYEQKVEEAKKAITAVFSDASVSKSATREALEDLQADIESMLESLPH